MRGSPSIHKSNPVAIVYDHEKYVQLSVQQTRWILKSIGVWPRSLESSSQIKRYVHALMNIICIGLVTFLFVPCVFYVVFEVEDTYNILKFTGPLSFCLMVFMKYSSLIFRGKDIRACIEHIKSDWMNTRHHGDRAIMIRNAEFGRRLVMISALFTYGGAVFYCIAMPISGGKITEEDSNLTYQPLIYPVARMIVDTRHNPVNEIFFWVQCVAGFITQAITAAASSLTAVLAIHACGRLEILIQWIVHLVDGREDLCDNVDERLAIIVQEHVRILRFITLTEKVLHEISLVEIVGCTLNICFLGYYVIMVGISCKIYQSMSQYVRAIILHCSAIILEYSRCMQNVLPKIGTFKLQEWEIGEFANYVTYTILLMSFIFNIFLFCYIGELVAEQCKKISEISYMIDWHRLSRKKALAVMLMITMSNSSVKLTAGNIIDLSISSFGDVIKTSVAYLNMLRTLTA